MQKTDAVLNGSLAGFSGLLIMIAQRHFTGDKNLDIIVAAVPICVLGATKAFVYLFRVFKLPTYQDAVAIPKIDSYIKSLHTAIEDQHVTDVDKETYKKDLNDAYRSKFKLYSN